MREAATALPTAVVLELSATRAPLADEPAQLVAAAVEEEEPDEPEPAPASPPPAVERPAKRSYSRSPKVGERNRRAILEALEDGPGTMADLTRRAGVPRSSMPREVARLEQAGKVIVQGEGRGKIVSLSGEPRQQQQPAPERPLSAGEQIDPPRAAATKGKAVSRREAERAAAADELKARIRDTLKEGPLTIDEIRAALGDEEVPKGRLLNVLQKAGGVRNSLRERDGNALWELAPLPHEQESVTIRHEPVDVDPSLSSRIVNLLAEQAMRIGDLAVELGGSHTAIALQVSLLERDGHIMRGRDGVYAVSPREGAQAA